MNTLVRVFLLFFSMGVLHAQESPVWNTYQAKQEKGVSSTNLRMDLVDKAPINGYDFLFYVKIKYRVTKESDFPIGNKLKKLYRIKDSIYSKMQSVSDSKYVGSFMYDGSRFEYYYVKDASDIERHIDKLFRNQFRGERYEVFVKSDPAWDLYVNFLYPNDEILNFMSNRDTVIQLKNAGDDVLAVRPIDHYAVFSSKNDMNLFEEAIKKLAYTVSHKKDLEKGTHPYEIKFQRDNSVTLENTLKFTTELIKLTKEFNGTYEGWETYVVKKED
ncbi:uncharacterized protein (TIGR01619 family) [Kordia periserrulae]|uniref:Uncharacterized protein (TIGR01619 family) n=1 Tax=Kordia periserrulae TaxID=701523 RepID=A0A2T6C3B3_9FLAO|nr:DUF695 domain-containing protein [Kordia periserrulae]PTX62811.1 uncharacterized protein (TIGR01619 family) [Kordia periserrulae]